MLNPDKSKLSKRQGHVSVDDFLNNGYLPEALINFIALLGWNPKNNDEIFSMDELINKFNIINIQKAGAVFDIDKLNWMNGQYLKHSNTKDIVPVAKKIFAKNNFIIKEELDFIKILDFAKSRSNTINDMVILSAPFFVEPEYKAKYLKLILDKKSKELFSLLINKINVLDEINEIVIKNIISNLSVDFNLKGKELFFPIRLAIWGDVHGPDIGLIIKILGKEKTLNRLMNALNYEH